MLTSIAAKGYAAFSWPDSTAVGKSSVIGESRALFFEQDAIPEAKHFHKIKKLKKKLLLLCLIGGAGKRKRSIPLRESRFFFPVIQHTDVNVGGSGTDDHGPFDSSGDGENLNGGIDCKRFMNTGHRDFGHLFLSSLVGVGGSNGGNNDSVGGNDDNRFYNKMVQRNFVRPLHQSMKYIYRLF